MSTDSQTPAVPTPPNGRPVSRRTFVAAAAGAAATLAGATAVAGGDPSATDAPTSGEEGTWVRTVCSPNCTGACGTKALVQDGQIRAILPAADYPYEHYNPRSCLRGLSFNTMNHGPDRLTEPLVRDEATGDLREASWDEALDTAAQKLNAVAEKYGPDSIAVIWQVQGTGHVQKGSFIRLSNMMGWSAIGCYEMNGDLPMFWPETFGCQSEELESYC